MTFLGEVLSATKEPIKVDDPTEAKLISVKLHGQGAVRRRLTDGKAPKPFIGNLGHAGQFVFSRIWARRGAMALIPDELEGVVVTAEFPLFNIKTDRLDPDYFNRLVQTPRFLAELERVSSGASGQNRIKESVFLGIEVDLPPLPEQRRIAAILDHADALRAKRRQVLAHLDALPQSIFHEMFGDTASNPHGYQRLPLGSLATKFSDGPFGSNLKSSHYTQDGVPVVRLQNIGVGEYKGSDKAFVSEEHYASLSKHDCRPGDVLIGTLGDPNLRACIQPENLPIALNKADCIQFRVNSARAHQTWACWMLNMPGTALLASGLAHGQTRTRIAMGQLRSLEVPVPPLELQAEFATRVREISYARSKGMQASAVNESLFASLQARAFRGEL